MINGAEEEVSWSILKKNCLIDSAHSDGSRGISLVPALQLDVKDALREISRLQRDSAKESDNVVTLMGQRHGNLV